MDEAMTDEQKTAHESLTRAIADLFAAYGAPGLLAEWLVIASHADFDHDGDASTVSYHCPPEQWLARSLGLVDFTHARLRARAMDAPSRLDSEDD